MVRRDARPASHLYRSVVPAAAADVFCWHERPEALLELMPPSRWVRIERRAGGVRDGGHVTFSIGIGPLRARWEVRHYGYIRGRQFCDEQGRGLFKTWRHIHRVEPIGSSQSLYEDRVEYAVRGGTLARLLVDPLVRCGLDRMFARRHQIVRADFASTRGPAHDADSRSDG